MPNQVYIKNKIKRLNPELGDQLEELGKKNLLWGVQPERTKPTPKKEEKKEDKKEDKKEE